MAVLLSPVGGVAGQFFDNNGNPLSGGKMYSYVAGTTTPQATYTSSSGVTAHSNPIVLDSGGRVPGGEIWLTDGFQYKFVLKTSTDVLIGTYDNIVGINSNFVNFLTETEVQTATSGQTVFTLATTTYQPGTNTLSVFVDGVNQYDGVTYAYTETSSTVVTFTAGLHVGALVKFTTAQTLSSGVTDASIVTYQPAGTGAVATTVQTKLRESVSVMDFGAVGDGVADDLNAFNAALLAAKTTGTGTVIVPHPTVTYLLSATPTEQSGVTLQYDPKDTSGAGIPAKGVQLAAVEGTPQNLYQHGYAAFLQVPLVNNGPYRYWTVYGAVDVPPGSTITPNDPGQDHLGVRGQSRSRSVNARTWGVVGLAQADQTATNDVEMGTCVGGEFDVNNNTGRDSINVDVDVFAGIFATGGNSMATAGFSVAAAGSNINAGSFITGKVYRIVTVGTTNFTLIGASSNTVGLTFVASGAGTGTGVAMPGGFWAGGVFKNYACRFYGLLFDNVAPISGAVYLSDLYKGGPALNVPNNKDALYLRNVANTNFAGRIRSTASDQLQIQGGAGGGYISNNADTQVNVSWTNGGTWSMKRFGGNLGTVNTAGVVASLPATDGIILLSAATLVTTVGSGDTVGQYITLHNRVVGTCTYINGSGMLLAASANFVANQFSTLTLFWDGSTWIEISRSAR